MALQRRQHRQTVHQVVAEHLVRIAQRRQVVDLVPTLQHLQVVHQTVEHHRADRQAQRDSSITQLLSPPQISVADHVRLGPEALRQRAPRPAPDPQRPQARSSL